MNAVISIILLAVALGVIVLLLTRRENTRRSQYGPAGLSEFRTDCRWTSASTGSTSTARPTSSLTSAAAKMTAASCSTSRSISPPSSRWTPSTPSASTPAVRPS